MFLYPVRYPEDSFTNDSLRFAEVLVMDQVVLKRSTQYNVCSEKCVITLPFCWVSTDLSYSSCGLLWRISAVIDGVQRNVSHGSPFD